LIAVETFAFPAMCVVLAAYFHRWREEESVKGRWIRRSTRTSSNRCLRIEPQAPSWHARAETYGCQRLEIRRPAHAQEVHDARQVMAGTAKNTPKNSRARNPLIISSSYVTFLFGFFVLHQNPVMGLSIPSVGFR
jgi:hypothetical protein